GGGAVHRDAPHQPQADLAAAVRRDARDTGRQRRGLEPRAEDARRPPPRRAGRGGAPPGADLAPSAGPVPGRCRALRTPARGPTAGRRGVSSRGRGLRTHVLESPDLRRVMRSPRGARELAPALGRALCLSAAWLFRWRTTIAGRAMREAQRFT